MSSVRTCFQSPDDTGATMADPEEEGLVDGQLETKNNVEAVRWCSSIRWSRWRGSSSACRIKCLSLEGN